MSKQVKLSVAGAVLLSKIQAGAQLTFSHGLGSFSRAYYCLGMEHVNGNTAKALERAGLIKALPYKLGEFSTEYVLTDTGRSWLHSGEPAVRRGTPSTKG